MKINRQQSIKRRRRRHRLPSVFSCIFRFTLILFVLTTIVYLSVSSKFQSIQADLLPKVLVLFALSTAIYFFTWIHRKKPPLHSQLLSSSLIIRLWLTAFPHSNRVLIIIDTVLLYVLLGDVIHSFLKFRKQYPVLETEAILLFLNVLSYNFDYTYLEDPNGLHLWQVPLILSIITTVVTVILLFNGSIRLEENRRSAQICTALVVCFVSFGLAWTTARNLNYALDSKPPTEYVAVIQEKDIRTGFRSPTRYVLSLELDGTLINLDVSQSEYESCAVGDSFSVDLYQGAFQEPFYISGN